MSWKPLSILSSSFQSEQRWASLSRRARKSSGDIVFRKILLDRILIRQYCMLGVTLLSVVSLHKFYAYIRYIQIVAACERQNVPLNQMTS